MYLKLSSIFSGGKKFLIGELKANALRIGKVDDTSDDGLERRQLNVEFGITDFELTSD